MLIGLDFGGITANHIPIKFEEAQRIFGNERIHTHRDVLRQVLLPQIGEQGYNELIIKMSERLGDFPVYEGAREAMDRLHKDGHRFALVSTQSFVALSVVNDYIKNHRLNFDHVAVVKEDAQKAEACRRFCVDAFLDDNTSVLQFLRPLNIPLVWGNFSGGGAVDVPQDFFMVNSWLEFEEWVRRHSDGLKV